MLDPGTPLAVLENWWARFELICEVKAIAAKNLLDRVPGISLSEGSPITLLLIDPDDVTDNVTSIRPAGDNVRAITSTTPEAGDNGSDTAGGGESDSATGAGGTAASNRNAA